MKVCQATSGGREDEEGKQVMCFCGISPLCKDQMKAAVFFIRSKLKLIGVHSGYIIDLLRLRHAVLFIDLYILVPSPVLYIIHGFSSCHIRCPCLCRAPNLQVCVRNQIWEPRDPYSCRASSVTPAAARLTGNDTVFVYNYHAFFCQGRD